MCLVNLQEEESYVPARVTTVKRRSRTYTPSPPVSRRVSRTRIVERRPAPPMIPVPPPGPPPPRSVRSVSPPRPPPSTFIERSSRVSQTIRAPSRAPSTVRHHVEVEEESSSSSSSSDEDIRSRATHKTSRTSHTHRSSRSRVSAPETEYSLHEKEREIRRSRNISRPRDEYETYRYVEAPSSVGRSQSRRGDYDDTRVNRISYTRTR